MVSITVSEAVGLGSIPSLFVCKKTGACHLYGSFKEQLRMQGSRLLKKDIYYYFFLFSNNQARNEVTVKRLLRTTLFTINVVSWTCSATLLIFIKRAIRYTTIMHIPIRNKGISNVVISLAIANIWSIESGQIIKIYITLIV